jgi:hypothetical protein
VADGFSIDQLAGLVVGGFAVMQRRRVEISGRERTVVWMQITDEGRQAIDQSAIGRLDKPADGRRGD